MIIEQKATFKSINFIIPMYPIIFCFLIIASENFLKQIKHLFKIFWSKTKQFLSIAKSIYIEKEPEAFNVPNSLLVLIEFLSNFIWDENENETKSNNIVFPHSTIDMRTSRQLCNALKIKIKKFWNFLFQKRYWLGPPTLFCMHLLKFWSFVYVKSETKMFS
jgi:hypothetical protein